MKFAALSFLVFLATAYAFLPHHQKLDQRPMSAASRRLQMSEPQVIFHRYRFCPLFINLDSTTTGGTSEPERKLNRPMKPGRVHSPESRAKISAANKGKKPWNVGVKHSQETRDRIRAGVLRRRKEKGYIPKPKPIPKPRGGPLPDEVKSKISEAMKLKWSNETFRAERLAALKESRNVASLRRGAATRVKISESLKRRWEDPAFRERQMSIRAEKGLDKPSAEVSRAMNQFVTSNSLTHLSRPCRVISLSKVRMKISKSLKHRWKDEKFRSVMMERIKRRRRSGGNVVVPLAVKEGVKGDERDLVTVMRTSMGMREVSDSDSSRMSHVAVSRGGEL